MPLTRTDDATRGRSAVTSSFLYHCARLIEILASIERVEAAAAAHKGWNGEKEKAEVLGRLAAEPNAPRPS